MKIKAIFSLIVCGLASSTTAAVSLPEPVLTAACSDATKIFYVNGGLASKGEAGDSLKHIKEAYEPLASTYGEIEFELAYNDNKSLILDVLETIGQKVIELGLDQQESTKDMIPYQYFLLNAAGSLLNGDDFPQAISDIITRKMLEEIINTIAVDKDNQATITEQVEISLKTGRKVILIAHSQGNLFANKVMAKVEDEYKGNIGMVGAASTASRLYSNSTYWTAFDDFVIALLRLGTFAHLAFPDLPVMSSVLPSNINNEVGIERSVENHVFVKSYFNVNDNGRSLPSRSMIDIDVERLLASLTGPECTITISDLKGSDGKITICHNPAKNPTTLKVPPPALPAHLRHGDTLGACSVARSKGSLTPLI